MNDEGRKGAYIYCVLAMFGWGSMFVACKFAYEAISGMTLLFFRYLVASSILLLIYRKRERPVLSGRDKRDIVLIGVLGYFLSIALQLVGTYYVDASLASIINTMTPVAMIVFAIWILGERSGSDAVDRHRTHHRRCRHNSCRRGCGRLRIAGIVLSIAGMVLWGLTSVLIRKVCSGLNPVWLTIYAMMVAIGSRHPLCDCRDIHVGGEYGGVGAAVMGILWVGVIPTAVSNLLWSRALEKLPAAHMFAFRRHHADNYRAAGSSALLSESTTVRFAAGSIVVIVGVIVAILGEKKDSLSS